VHFSITNNCIPNRSIHQNFIIVSFLNTVDCRDLFHEFTNLRNAPGNNIELRQTVLYLTSKHAVQHRTTLLESQSYYFQLNNGF
jgi:hypothetical protein